MYQFIPLHQAHTNRRFYLNARYITDTFTRQETTYVRVERFTAVPVTESLEKVRELLRITPSQKNKEVKARVPAILHNTVRIPLSKVVYIRPFDNGHSQLTFADKKDRFILDSPEYLLSS